MRDTQLKIQASSAWPRHLALIEHDVAGGIDAGGDEGRGHLAGVVLELVRVLEHGDGVEIDHAIEAVMLGLKRHEARDGAEIVAEMEIAGGLNAGEYACFCLGPSCIAGRDLAAGYGVGREGAQASLSRWAFGVEFGECQ